MADDKASAIKELQDEYENFRRALKGLEPEQLSRPFLDGWSVKEIVAHVMGWEQEMVAALERMARGERPTPEGVDYSDGDAWNAKFEAQMAAISPQTVLATWRQAHMNYVNAAKDVPEERYGERDGKPQTVNRLLQTSGTGHYEEHAEAIREWRKKEGL